MAAVTEHGATVGETFRKMAALAERHEAALVAFSGGKDSLCVIDMAVRTFRKVVGVHLYFIPGMEVEMSRVREAEERWGVPMLLYPDPRLLDVVRDGLFTNPGWYVDGIPKWTFDDVLDIARRESGIRLVLTGRKWTDGVGIGLTNRKKARTKKGGEEDLYLPLARWNKWHVLAYLSQRKIPAPENDGRNSGSIDCTTDSILWLHDKHPEDFKRFCKVFHYAPAVVERRRLFGIS